jgi:transcriptional regulator with XRE-family HTH domain
MATGIDWTPARIRQFRTSHHFTLTSFGRAMGATGALEVQPFSRQAINSWETGVYPPSTEALRSLDVLAKIEDFTP